MHAQTSVDVSRFLQEVHVTYIKKGPPNYTLKYGFLTVCECFVTFMYIEGAIYRLCNIRYFASLVS